ncbi:uncharacterized protein N7482_004791 [Penicillium canariense]|uniref:Uncharacterized protein n=1 Tax=Penicillium canariense TaxID=189055 RepID=A0A9W9LPX0_9EURO|nr:uncharacterized protein N7482_004791 [Penicillium canariense]KAJ5169197.1 hypothetical protein N7482_004791 [Penicillium canariense]
MPPRRKKSTQKPKRAAQRKEAIHKRQGAVKGKSSGEASSSATKPETQPLSNVATLDLDVSYVGKLEPPPPPPKLPERKQWQLTGTKELPVGWNWDEPDLHNDDIEAQIERCHVRISENILPDTFRKKLVVYEERLVEKKELMKNHPGLSWAVIQRLEDLKGIRDWLEEEGDHLELKPIVEALMVAYKDGNLDIYTDLGLVTYWSKGKQISQPRPFDLQEYQAIAHEFRGDRAFWVEGLFGHSTPRIGQVLVTRANNIHGMIRDPTFQNEVDMSFALPLWGIQNSRGPHVVLPCTDDTGSDYSCLYYEDITDILDWYRTQNLIGYAPVAHITHVSLANGVRQLFAVVFLWINLHHPSQAGHPPMPSWDLIQCIVWTHPRSSYNRPARINGPWMRFKIYTASAPEGTPNMWLFDKKSGFIERVPTVRTAMHQRIMPHLAPRLN